MQTTYVVYEYNCVHQLAVVCMRGSRKFRQRGTKFDNVLFLVDEGMEVPNTTKGGPSLARQRNAI